MPELAEVVYYAHRWNEGLGKRIERVSAHPEARCFRRRLGVADLQDRLQARRLTSAHTHGKQMLWKIDGGGWLLIHLGMTGKLRRDRPDLQPEKHDHLVLFQERRTLVFSDPRMFGQVRLHEESNGFPAFWRNLPPELLSDGFTKRRLAAFLHRRARSPLKALLLDQAMFPGIGNWMADEVLWRCRFHPALPAGHLHDAEIALLWKQLRHVCRLALHWIAPDWKTPPTTWLFNHRWKNGGTCPCGAPLTRENIGGRTTCWCPGCQGTATDPTSY